MSSFDLRKILRDGNSLSQLLCSKNDLGVTFYTIADGKVVGLKNDAIDLGLLYLPDIAIGGSGNLCGDELCQERVVNTTLLVCVLANTTIATVEILPESKSADCPILEYTLQGLGGASVALPFEASYQCPLTISLSIRIPFKWSGYIGRTVIFKVLRRQEVSPIALLTSEMLCGVKLSGCVLTTKVKAALSIDAKPFIPTSLLRYFDTQLRSTFEQARALPSIAPLRFQQFMQSLPQVSIPRELREEYISSLIGNRIGDFASRCRRGGGYVQEHLHLLSSVTLYEEVHMSYDIMFYDLHSVQLSFEEDKSTGLILAKFKVKGSSENRPNIAIGDFIYLRPSNIMECASFCALLNPTIKSVHDNPFISLAGNEFFELVGTIVSYKLASEEVVARFLFPFHSDMVKHYDLRKYNTPNQAWKDLIKREKKSSVNFLKNTSFHCRFSFDTTAFCFIQSAIRGVLADKELQRRLFPDRDQYRSIEEQYTRSRHSDKHEGASRVDRRSGRALNREQCKAVDDILFLLKSRKALGKTSIDDDGSDSSYSSSSSSSRSSSPSSGQIPPPTEGLNELPLYVVYGPPGTGKTSCAVEAILAAVAADPHCRVLACAPSDAAADVICDRLAGTLGGEQLLRLCFWKKNGNSLPTKLFQYACVGDNGIFELPALQTVKRASVVVSTCGASGTLSSMCADGLFFDLVLIDESSQATEAESLVPIMCARHCSVVVLCGDPKQLAAQTRSPMYDFCARYTSLQERLLLSEAYHSLGYTCEQDGPLSIDVNNSILGTFLTKNYRSHESIIRLSSKLFYGSRLETLADRGNVDSLLCWERLPSGRADNFACLFIGVNGKHQHDIDSPSFYNIYEIQEIVNAVGELVLSSIVKVSTADIGIICAFRSQVLRTRAAMRNAGYGQINIGSIEDFQGQECKVIIISTVLSQRVSAFVSHRGAHGLCGDARKFNVAITRGMALTLVVGNPFFLVTDPHWKAYLNYCDSNGCYAGCPCPYLDSSKDSDLDLNVIAEYAAVMGSETEPAQPNVNANSDHSWRLMM